MESLKIYIDRLKDGHEEKVSATLTPEQLHITDERELRFPQNVQVSGEAYLADDHLVLRLSIETAATLPCSICNEAVRVPLCVQQNYSTIPLEEIPSATYDLTDEIRETMLLQLPLFIECQGGNCPERSRLSQFMPPATDTPTTPHHFPFADLD